MLPYLVCGNLYFFGLPWTVSNYAACSAMDKLLFKANLTGQVERNICHQSVLFVASDLARSRML